MNIFERSMLMSDAVWRRHANPYSVYSRFTVLPLLSLAVWSREWIGTWALVPVALALIWNWYNPRAFSPVPDTKGWASQGGVGERIFLNRKNIAVAKEHVIFVYLLSAITALFAVLLAWGLWQLNAPITVLSLCLAVAFKTRTFDGMFWIYRDHDRDGENTPLNPTD